MATSKAPAAIDALFDLCTDSSALAKVTKVDGPPLTNLDSPELLFIGWSPEAASAGITQTFASAGARRRDEDIAIACYAEARSGGTAMRPVRQQVFDIVAAVETVLRATDDEPEAPTLRGAVLWAQLVTGDLVQLQTPDGALAGLAFTVACRARL